MVFFLHASASGISGLVHYLLAKKQTLLTDYVEKTKFLWFQLEAGTFMLVMKRLVWFIAENSMVKLNVALNIV